jgi:hypothetical protein
MTARSLERARPRSHTAGAHANTDPDGRQPPIDDVDLRLPATVMGFHNQHGDFDLAVI